ncbi:hypothetical protein O4H49_19195 [Kiloniella laminariae]|uniref:Uncharacterized protein n=1 Tax=Kiloniella laminariae TaxID=454162 RepID=A0ABT4LP72_9PROT|nr:hypothetical protein [Kiloniella laminariae]MCZ4282919.1 hypothetical protein [Kiloniella laminariae]
MGLLPGIVTGDYYRGLLPGIITGDYYRGLLPGIINCHANAGPTTDSDTASSQSTSLLIGENA